MTISLIPSNPGQSESEDDIDKIRRLLDDLSEQLHRATGGDVEGDVSKRGRGDKIRLDFDLYAPRLPYSYPAFWIEHGIDGFPVDVYREGANVEKKSCPTLESLAEEIREIFKSQGAIDRVIGKLRRLSQDTEHEDD